MRIFVDADACPVVRQTEEVAKKYSVPVTLLCDTNHILQSDYSEVRVIGAGADAVDTDALGAKVSGKVAHGGFESSLGNAHDVIGRHNSGGTEIGHGEHR